MLFVVQGRIPHVAVKLSTFAHWPTLSLSHQLPTPLHQRHIRQLRYRLFNHHTLTSTVILPLSSRCIVVRIRSPLLVRRRLEPPPPLSHVQMRPTPSRTIRHTFPRTSRQPNKRQPEETRQQRAVERNRSVQNFVSDERGTPKRR